MYDQRVHAVGNCSGNNSRTPEAAWRPRLLTLAGALLSCTLVSCATAQKPAPQFAASTESLEAIAPRQCVTESMNPVQCFSDSDCCAGFVCGKDPELSQRLTFCIFGG